MIFDLLRQAGEALVGLKRRRRRPGALVGGGSGDAYKNTDADGLALALVSDGLVSNAKEEDHEDHEEHEEDLDHLRGRCVEQTGRTWPDGAPFDAGSFFDSLCGTTDMAGAQGVSAVRLHDLRGFVRWPGCLDLNARLPGLAVLEVSHCRIKSLFAEDLVLPPRLRRLALTYDCLEEFEVELPLSLRDLDLSFNKLTRLPACLERIRELVIVADRPDDDDDDGVTSSQDGERRHDAARCRLELRNNNFWFCEYTDVTPGRVNRDTMVELTRAHDWGLLSASKLRRAMDHLLDGTRVQHAVTHHRTTYADPQNVHKSSVQTSVKEALARLMAWTESLPDVRVPPNLRAFDPRFVETLIRRMALSKIAAAQFRVDCADATVHGTLQVTFGNLCELLLRFVSAQPAAKEIFAVMGQEYARNVKVCFTGKVTHLLACLNGFVDGFAVGIDSKDELANKLVAIRNKWSQLAGLDFHEYVAQAIPEAMQALEDACVPIAEQAHWLEGI